MIRHQSLTKIANQDPTQKTLSNKKGKKYSLTKPQLHSQLAQNIAITNLNRDFSGKKLVKKTLVSSQLDKRQKPLKQLLPKPPLQKSFQTIQQTSMADHQSHQPIQQRIEPLNLSQKYRSNSVNQKQMPNKVLFQPNLLQKQPVGLRQMRNSQSNATLQPQGDPLLKPNQKLNGATTQPQGNINSQNPIIWQVHNHYHGEPNQKPSNYLVFHGDYNNLTYNKRRATSPYEQKLPRMPNSQLLYEDGPRQEPPSSEFSDITGDASSLAPSQLKMGERKNSLMERKLAVYESLSKFKYGTNDFKLLDQMRKGKKGKGPTDKVSKRLVALENTMQFKEIKKLQKRKQIENKKLSPYSNSNKASLSQLSSNLAPKQQATTSSSFFNNTTQFSQNQRSRIVKFDPNSRNSSGMLRMNKTQSNVLPLKNNMISAPQSPDVIHKKLLSVQKNNHFLTEMQNLQGISANDSRGNRERFGSNNFNEILANIERSNFMEESPMLLKTSQPRFQTQTVQLDDQTQATVGPTSSHIKQNTKNPGYQTINVQISADQQKQDEQLITDDASSFDNIDNKISMKNKKGPKKTGIFAIGDPSSDDGHFTESLHSSFSSELDEDQDNLEQLYKDTKDQILARALQTPEKQKPESEPVEFKQSEPNDFSEAVKRTQTSNKKHQKLPPIDLSSLNSTAHNQSDKVRDKAEKQNMDKESQPKVQTLKIVRKANNNVSEITFQQNDAQTQKSQACDENPETQNPIQFLNQSSKSPDPVDIPMNINIPRSVRRQGKWDKNKKKNLFKKNRFASAENNFLNVRTNQDDDLRSNSKKSDKNFSQQNPTGLSEIQKESESEAPKLRFPGSHVSGHTLGSKSSGRAIVRKEKAQNTFADKQSLGEVEIITIQDGQDLIIDPLITQVQEQNGKQKYLTTNSGPSLNLPECINERSEESFNDIAPARFGASRYPLEIKQQASLAAREITMSEIAVEKDSINQFSIANESLIRMHIREPTTINLERALLQEIDFLSVEQKPLNFQNVGLFQEQLTDVSQEFLQKVTNNPISKPLVWKNITQFESHGQQKISKNQDLLRLHSNQQETLQKVKNENVKRNSIGTLWGHQIEQDQILIEDDPLENLSDPRLHQDFTYQSCYTQDIDRNKQTQSESSDEESSFVKKPQSANPIQCSVEGMDFFLNECLLVPETSKRQSSGLAGLGKALGPLMAAKKAEQAAKKAAEEAKAKGKLYEPNKPEPPVANNNYGYFMDVFERHFDYGKKGKQRHITAMQHAAAFSAIQQDGIGGVRNAISFMQNKINENDEVNETFNELKIDTTPQIKEQLAQNSDEESDMEKEDKLGIQLFQDIHGRMHLDYKMIDHQLIQAHEDSLYFTFLSKKRPKNLNKSASLEHSQSQDEIKLSVLKNPLVSKKLKTDMDHQGILEFQKNQRNLNARKSIKKLSKMQKKDKKTSERDLQSYGQDLLDFFDRLDRQSLMKINMTNVLLRISPKDIKAAKLLDGGHEKVLNMLKISQKKDKKDEYRYITKLRLFIMNSASETNVPQSPVQTAGLSGMTRNSSGGLTMARNLSMFKKQSVSMKDLQQKIIVRENKDAHDQKFSANFSKKFQGFSKKKNHQKTGIMSRLMFYKKEAEQKAEGADSSYQWKLELISTYITKTLKEINGGHKHLHVFQEKQFLYSKLFDLKTENLLQKQFGEVHRINSYFFDEVQSIFMNRTFKTYSEWNRFQVRLNLARQSEVKPILRWQQQRLATNIEQLNTVVNSSLSSYSIPAKENIQKEILTIFSISDDKKLMKHSLFKYSSVNYPKMVIKRLAEIYKIQASATKDNIAQNIEHQILNEADFYETKSEPVSQIIKDELRKKELQKKKVQARNLLQFSKLIWFINFHPSDEEWVQVEYMKEMSDHESYQKAPIPYRYIRHQGPITKQAAARRNLTRLSALNDHRHYKSNTKDFRFVLNDEFGYVLNVNVNSENDNMYFIYLPILIPNIREPISVVDRLKSVFRFSMQKQQRQAAIDRETAERNRISEQQKEAENEAELKRRPSYAQFDNPLTAALNKQLAAGKEKKVQFQQDKVTEKKKPSRRNSKVKVGLELGPDDTFGAQNKNTLDEKLLGIAEKSEKSSISGKSQQDDDYVESDSNSCSSVFTPDDFMKEQSERSIEVNDFLDKNMEDADSDGFNDSEVEGQKIKFKTKMQMAFQKLVAMGNKAKNALGNKRQFKEEDEMVSRQMGITEQIKHNLDKSFRIQQHMEVRKQERDKNTKRDPMTSKKMFKDLEELESQPVEQRVKNTPNVVTILYQKKRKSKKSQFLQTQNSGERGFSFKDKIQEDFNLNKKVTNTNFSAAKSKNVMQVRVCKGFKPVKEGKMASQVDRVQIQLQKTRAKHAEEQAQAFEAIEQGKTESVKDYISKNLTGIDETNEDGNTLLNVAAQYGCYDTCYLLIKSGANVNTQNNQNNTPLHYANAFYHRKIVDLLVQNQANEKIKNLKKKTPWEGL